MRLVIETLPPGTDLTEFVDAMFESFYTAPDTKDYAAALWGRDNPESRKRALERLQHEQAEEKNIAVRAVRDLDAGGKIVSGTEWHVNLNSTASIYAPWNLECPWFSGQERADAEKLLTVLPDNMNAAIQKVGGPLGEPHVRLDLMWTSTSYHGKGAGTLGLQWGLDLADCLNLPSWVEASTHGRRLYEKAGFVRMAENEVRIGDFHCVQTPMRRPAKHSDKI